MRAACHRGLDSQAAQSAGCTIASKTEPIASRSRVVFFGITNDGITKVRRLRPTVSPRKTRSENPAIEEQAIGANTVLPSLFVKCRCCLSYSR
jgi:hypothetical protein